MRKANGDSKNVPLNDTVTPFLNEDGNSSSTSSKSEDNARLMAALEAASNQSSSDDEDIYVEDEDDDYSNDDDDDKSGNSSSSSSGFGGDYLGGNGNSLPHPDEYAINKSSGHSGSVMMSSFKWGNIKMSLRSTFSKTNDKGDIESVSDDGEDFADETTSRANKRDEEMGYYSNGDDNDASSSESDSDSDFSDEEPASKKDRMLSLFKEHKDNPRSRLICLVSFIVFLLLFIVTPVAVRKTKAKNNIITTTTDIGNTPGDGIGPIIPPPISSDGSNCFDEIVLTDRNGRDLVNGTDTSDDLACYSIDEPIHFRFKRCRPASPLDWVGVFSSRSMFMDKLWKDHYDGVYLCGDQPCPDDDSLNMEGGPPRIQATKAPPIKTPGEYRLFLVKDSDWPYEFVKHTAAFHVVDSPHICANKDNIFTPPTPNSGGKAAESVYVDLPTMVPTAPVSSVGSVAATTWDSVTSTPEEFNSIGTRE
uniref:Uncharacterized protein n=1 Tax=Pseudo-nitzschia arenysensis TaxID=697910 RepID=A0A7S0F7G5_9STRA